MSEQSKVSAEELEQLGDEALAAGEFEQALAHYRAAHSLILDVLDPALIHEADFDLVGTVTDNLSRVGTKADDLWRKLQPPPKSAAERAGELRANVDEAMATGDLADASHAGFRLGETLEELNDREGAESAYRRAVVLARQVDADDPELMLAAFSSLIHFLSPSEESVALAQEMVANLIDRRETYHPMRAADAAYHWAIAELKFAEVAQHRMDHAIDGVARQAIEMLDGICFHKGSQKLQRVVAGVLRSAGRDSEADQWQADADKYEDWEWFMEQEIPGHVHLWDIRIDLPTHGREDE
ncbi:hypothetical protein [Mycolicibacterium brisbanense]|uniref:Cytochrome c biogenesis factor n=1 Tax=Mycolicibacterium brisbanense TaxID=146020 RepID=A0A100W6G4_9MYCO|nr:hypothetical protein [Mycolicibacterium brisbanense]MCV7157825.1 hypothetical protein [Mycolicibacterium brisbanense]GAS92470.1 cytochrome c biogenesis factor [Mycolicibacterium brisbanense]